MQTQLPSEWKASCSHLEERKWVEIPRNSLGESCRGIASRRLTPNIAGAAGPGAGRHSRAVLCPRLGGALPHSVRFFFSASWIGVICSELFFPSLKPMWQNEKETAGPSLLPLLASPNDSQGHSFGLILWLLPCPHCTHQEAKQKALQREPAQVKSPQGRARHTRAQLRDRGDANSAQRALYCTGHL